MEEALSDPGTQRAASNTISVLSLELTDFRNYDHLSLSLGSMPVVLTGTNGSGKTNLLEAVSLLTPGRGLRRARLGDIDRYGGGSWVISVQLHTNGDIVQIGTGRDPQATPHGREKRLVRIDGEPLRGQAELANYCAAIWLTPQMDQLFMEGNAARRRFLDRLVYGFDPKHATRVNAYERTMSERNRLLTERYGDRTWFEAVERRLSESAAAIAMARLQTVAHLNHAMEEADSVFPKGKVQVRGLAEDALREGKNEQECVMLLTAALEHARTEDRYRGRTSVGVHKSEFIVHHATKGMEAERCSTGEQKALLLSLVLAQARAGRQRHGRLPVLLLDEVIAHLDDTRRAALCEEILALGCQAWMTGTDREFFTGLKGRAQFLEVREGKVE